MNECFRLSINQAIAALKKGGVIAYPTEAVYGIGCLANHQEAVARVLAIKDRAAGKGLITVVSSWAMMNGWWDHVPDARLAQIKASWPGHTTYVFPAGEKAPAALCHQQTIAIRMSDHPIVCELCEACGPLVSTSANLAGTVPCQTIVAIERVLGTMIAGVLEGPVGRAQQPSCIIDACTGHVIR